MPNYPREIRRAAKRYGINPRIFLAQLRAESGGNLDPNARSGAGARGIAQFMPATAKQYGVNLNDGKTSDDIDGAARYMRDNLRRTGGNYHAALSIYNSGRPDGYRRIPETQAYVKKILGEAGGNPGATPTEDQSYRPGRIVTTPGVDRSGDRSGLLLQYLTDKHKPGAFLALAQGIQGAQDTPSSSRRLPGQMITGGGGGGGTNARVQEANRINAAHVPYQWGGGHAAKQPRGSKVTPLDCSGAVSRVLGIDPRVSGDFARWGKPGRSKHGTTIYANSHHVLMEINGRFFGTSASNPGGGAGWIPRAQISPQYLRGFTARHG